MELLLFGVESFDILMYTIQEHIYIYKHLNASKQDNLLKDM